MMQGFRNLKYIGADIENDGWAPAEFREFFAQNIECI